MPQRLITAALLAMLAWPVSSAGADSASDDLEFFEQKIRPVLMRECYQCHSAGSKQVKGGLLLDTREGLLRGGDSGPAVVPGKSSEGSLLSALKQESFEMPPKGKLTDEVIADFAHWISRGAIDPRVSEVVEQSARSNIDFDAARKYWAFQPPVRGPLPPVKDTAWPKNEVDHYILAALEAHQLKPVAPATKRELIRRATFDLTGLPPMPSEIDAFLADESAQAFARVVDRLLASPHYGERWGRYWLDVARYAEDQAHTFGVKPNTSGYRYRDWVVDALNGDMPYDEFVKLQIAGDQLNDNPAGAQRQVAALGFFGFGAQYYKNSDAAKASADELDDRVDTLTRGFLGLTVSCARCHDHKFDPIPTQDYYSLAGVFQSCKLVNTPLAPKEEVQAYESAQAKIKDCENRIKKFTTDNKRVATEAEISQVPKYLQAVWKQRATDKEGKPLSTKVLARQGNLRKGTLKKWLELVDVRNRGKLPALDPWFDLQVPERDAASELLDDGNEMPAEVVTASLAVQQNLQAALDERDGQKNKPSSAKLSQQTQDLLAAVFGEKGVMSVSDGELDRFLSAADQQMLGDMKRNFEAAKKNAPPMYAVAHTIADATPADMKVFVRGNPARTGELAPRRFLRVLSEGEPSKFNQGSGRRELAEVIASPANPLTARVMVNRLWQHHFGRGLVGTPSNFGALGEKPTHPELLDYLAVRFVDLGWSMKAIHRELMLSATYQLSSRSDAQNEQTDADDRWLWHMNRKRLDVESWRNALLAVSGQLDPRLGGPSIDLAQGNNKRRTVYAKISRHDLDGLLRLFDFPDANITSDTRSETTVPQQQLFVLNSPFMIEQAKALAARLQNDKSLATDPARVKHAFLLSYGRPATDDEVQVIVGFLNGNDSEEVKRANKLTRRERAAQAMLGANEFMYVD